MDDQRSRLYLHLRKKRTSVNFYLIYKLFFCNHKYRPGTINPSVVLLFSLLFAAQISGLGRKDEEEGRIVVVSDPVLIQGFSVLGETLPDHPTLEGRVEIIVTIDLKNKLGMRAQVKL